MSGKFKGQAPSTKTRSSGDVRPAKFRTLDIEGQPVRCIEADDGKRVWICDCAKFKERAARRADALTTLYERARLLRHSKHLSVQLMTRLSKKNRIRTGRRELSEAHGLP
jgi:hypothetical protein